jgi:hypothetical protein
MNYDGKAVVINTNFDLFYSEGDSAIVMDVLPEYNLNDFFMLNNHIVNNIKSLNNSYVVDINFIANNNNNIQSVSVANIIPDYIANNNNNLQYNSISNIIPELVPYTVQVYNKKDLIYYGNFNDFDKSLKYDYSNKSNSFIEFKSYKNDYYKPITIKILDNNRNFSNDVYEFKTVKVSDVILKTNVFSKEIRLMNILDLTYSYQSNINFSPVYMNIGDKMEFFVPTLSDNFQNMSVIVQKDTFIELKFDSTILNVIGLPEGLQFTLGVIKGTITKSGSYDITIQYEKGSQKLNIIVPYYQRLL